MNLSFSTSEQLCKDKVSRTQKEHNFTVNFIMKRKDGRKKVARNPFHLESGVGEGFNSNAGDLRKDEKGESKRNSPQNHFPFAFLWLLVFIK